jgi:hypothetical protein
VGQIGPQWLSEFGENDRFLTASCGIYTSHTLQLFLHILSEKDTKDGLKKLFEVRIKLDKMLKDKQFFKIHYA